VLCVAGLAAAASTGWPQRFDAKARQLLAGADDRNLQPEVCSELSGADLLAGKACRLGAGNVAPTVIVWGDSHADTLMTVFDRLGAESGRSVLFLGKIGCAPLLDVERLDLPFGCKAYNDAARRLIAASGATRVVLVARWSHYTYAPTFRHEERTRLVLADAQSTRPAVENNDAVLARARAHPGVSRAAPGVRRCDCS